MIIDRERVLLHRSEVDPFWSLPGGKPQLMEHAADAVARELREELDSAVQVERLLWVVEYFFQSAGKKRRAHELGLYFLVSLPEGSPYLQSARPFEGREDSQNLRLFFQWFRREAAVLDTLDLYPRFLRQALLDIPGDPTHIVIKDE